MRGYLCSQARVLARLPQENGRQLTTKEAFRRLAHQFHGITPGKKKLEKMMVRAIGVPTTAMQAGAAVWGMCWRRAQPRAPRCTDRPFRCLSVLPGGVGGWGLAVPVRGCVQRLEAEEKKMHEMSVIDTPLQSTAALAAEAERQGKAFINLDAKKVRAQQCWLHAAARHPCRLDFGCVRSRLIDIPDLCSGAAGVGEGAETPEEAGEKG